MARRGLKKSKWGTLLAVATLFSVPHQNKPRQFSYWLSTNSEKVSNRESAIITFEPGLVGLLVVTLFVWPS